MALSSEVLKWFYEAQKQLKEQFDLDTSRPEDLGRLKSVHLYKENEAGELVPLGWDESVTYQNEVVTDAHYATAARAENGIDYANPMPESVDKRLDWIQKSQRTFHVTEGEGGTLTMNSSMSDEELMQLYNEAKNGSLTASKPGGDVRSSDGSGMFLCVDKDGMPAFCDSGFGYLKDLSIEQLEQFYQRHPDMLDRKITDREALTLARIEYSELNKLENPRMIYDRIDMSVQNMQGGSFDENVKWWDDYENLALRQLHAGAVPATYQQASMMQRTIPGMLMQQNIQHDLTMGDGLDKFMVTDGNIEMPLFPDHKELQSRLKAGDLYAIADMQRRLGEAALGGKLTYFSRDPQNPGQYKGFHFAKNKKGGLTTEPLPTKKPSKLPWYKSVFSIFFRADVAKYRKDTAAYESYERMKPICEMMTDPESEQGAREPAKKAPNPEKEARKAKLAKMTPEERFEYDVAEQVQRTYQKTTNPRIYLKMCKVTADDVQKDPSFKEFMQSEKMQAAMDKKLHGTAAEKEKIFPGILAQEYVNGITQKVQEAAKTSAAPKAPAQNGAPQNSAAQNANQKKAGPVMGGH